MAALKTTVDWLKTLSPDIQQAVVWIAARVAAICPALVVLGMMAQGIAGLSATMRSRARCS